MICLGPGLQPDLTQYPILMFLRLDECVNVDNQANSIGAEGSFMCGQEEDRQNNKIYSS